MDNNHPNDQNFAALYGNLNTDEQLAFDLIWELEHTDPAYAPAEQPQGYVLGGQPGSGKSTSAGGAFFICFLYGHYWIFNCRPG